MPEKLTKSDLRLIAAARYRPDDLYGDAGQRLRSAINREAGCALYETALWDRIAELIQKLNPKQQKPCSKKTVLPAK